MKAVVLCAGYGTRLGDLTRDIPKPMLRLEGQPLLAFLLGHLQAQGFLDVAVNLHFHPEVIRDWFGDGARWQMRLAYSYEPRLLGTAGALKNLEDFMRGEEAFLVQYGDVLTDQDFGRLLQAHREKRALATLLVHQRPCSNSLVQLDDTGRIVGFLERPDEAARLGAVSPWVNSGVCVCSSEILAHIPRGTASDLPRDVFVPLVGSGRLQAVPLTGFRCAIDSSGRLAEARAAVAGQQCRIRPLPDSGASHGHDPREGR
jgi:NDP-sugar pyrophosphorylase family protein